MTWRVAFDDALDADLQIVSYELAATACEAVYRFAESGEGRAYPLDVDATVWRIFVPGGYAVVRANADTLDFLRIFPDDPAPTFQPLLDAPESEGDEDD